MRRTFGFRFRGFPDCTFLDISKVELAAVHGVGVCSVRRSNHFGMASYYPLKAAEKDMIGFSCTNSVSNAAPFGAKQGMLGISPFAFCAPIKDSAPFCLDISCASVPEGVSPTISGRGK